MSNETVPVEKHDENTRTNLCSWCGQEMTVSSRGRPRKYCKQSCKQRAYESRKWNIGMVWGHLQETYSQCYICGEVLEWERPQTICLDHVIATVHGGRTDVENLRPVHLLCNARKGMKLFVPALAP